MLELKLNEQAWLDRGEYEKGFFNGKTEMTAGGIVFHLQEKEGVYNPSFKDWNGGNSKTVFAISKLKLLTK